METDGASITAVARDNGRNREVGDKGREWRSVWREELSTPTMPSKS